MIYFLNKEIKKCRIFCYILYLHQHYFLVIIIFYIYIIIINNFYKKTVFLTYYSYDAYIQYEISRNIYPKSTTIFDTLYKKYFYIDLVIILIFPYPWT